MRVILEVQKYLPCSRTNNCKWWTNLNPEYLIIIDTVLRNNYYWYQLKISKISWDFQKTKWPQKTCQYPLIPEHRCPPQDCNDMQPESPFRKGWRILWMVWGVSFNAQISVSCRMKPFLKWKKTSYKFSTSTGLEVDPLTVVEATLQWCFLMLSLEGCGKAVVRYYTPFVLGGPQYPKHAVVLKSLGYSSQPQTWIANENFTPTTNWVEAAKVDKLKCPNDHMYTPLLTTPKCSKKMLNSFL